MSGQKVEFTKTSLHYHYIIYRFNNIHIKKGLQSFDYIKYLLKKKHRKKTTFLIFSKI